MSKTTAFLYVDLPKKQEQEAKMFYQALETNAYFDVVLISLDKVKQLKSAYPNYFLDSKNFSKFIKESYKELLK
ncbi:hypothetical protein [Campylobacter hyointestinalis]|uniref:hypothetical protein n=2 Tax=Campylobacter hyointestinalis TaxID=198 RepID=UPI00069192CA|nr:hypothetical protein [Campylobacter hyointestinalis]MBT0612921.1 hypothetical protein [Campylobacter hyointestinalis subsp. hyointestinalis]MDY2999676.1 hypothetical protein [Campylobacter hyointestinalis]TWO30380.1 hypothetical protein YZ79_03385 [Campylobacter hyointestinalis]TXK48845.1 hypothetical protein A0Z69_00140 [Campylobacter hyointestinalis]SFT68573.1 hypothetical protein SAMN05421691_1793 [Campylobacter hyointestinalis]